MELGDVAYESRRAGNDLEIKIGDPDVAVSGEHTYVIKYKYDVGADNITEFDDVYFNLLGKWDAVINHFQFTVRMPKPFDRNNVTLYTGDAQNADIEYHVVGDTVTGSSRTALHDEDVTIRILLDEGYFVGARQLSNTYVYAAVVVVCLLTVCSALLWLFFGRDDKVFPKAIYYPPPGITPADAGYILKGSVSDADMSALVLYWADKGYLDVQQMEDGTMRFSKRREADAGMQGYEQRIFNKMFEDREDVSPMVLQFSTAQTVQAAKKDLTDGFTKNPFRRIFTRKSRVVQALSCLFSGCCIGVFARRRSLYADIFGYEFRPVRAADNGRLFWARNDYMQRCQPFAPAWERKLCNRLVFREYGDCGLRWIYHDRDEQSHSAGACRRSRRDALQHFRGVRAQADGTGEPMA